MTHDRPRELVISPQHNGTSDEIKPLPLHLNCFNKPHSEVSTPIFNDVYFSDSKWRVMAEPLQIDVMLQVKNWRIETFYSNAY